MTFSTTPIDGLKVITLNAHQDERGMFMRTFCEDEFTKAGIPFRVSQTNLSLTVKKGMIRGMHFQVAPHAETKVVYCIRGAIFDVAIDLRTDSSTYGQWYGIELSETNHHMFYLPKGFAHGFQTLTDQCVVAYLMSNPYVATSASGVRYNDPFFHIIWPLPELIAVNEKDAQWPLLPRPQ